MQIEGTMHGAVQVGHRLTQATASHNGTAAHSLPEIVEAVHACHRSGRPCVLVAASYPAAGGAFTTQGAALPGMTVAAVVAALQAAQCSASIATEDGRVADALRQFEYSVEVQRTA